jgi:hypothetical protein
VAPFLQRNVRPNEESLFEAARNLPNATARNAFLDEACAGEPEMRARIEALLEAGNEAEIFFKNAVPLDFSNAAKSGDSKGNSTSESPLLEGLGTRIGRYKLLQKIGEGGGGVIYMAEQEEPVRRRVALKIIKLGMDTKSVIARFEAERQALAMMDHLNIARVFDAGATVTGRPYFVMELVRGVKITEYCDQNNLDTRQRLELFIQICQAIQHAHQKGIIHRDIKPSNILVTLHDGVPVPKVIDFGIAKAIEARLTDKTLFTSFEQIIGTPAYMSPEQAEMSGLDVDTRSDIYSLGVLLYELLTSKTPFDAKQLIQGGLDEMRRTLREQEPQRPSTMVTTLIGVELKATAEHRHAEPPKLISLLRGDLDWIVMKALDKDRRRRYETANGLAMDIKRYLNSEPVFARPPSRLYRFQKMVRRNKAVFAAVSAVALALLVGIGVSTRLYLMEKAAYQRADEAEQRAEWERIKEVQLRQQAETREKITQATVLINQGNYDEADELARGISVTQPSVEGAIVFRALGEYHAVRNHWQEAADRFKVLMQINQLDGWDVCTLDYLRYGPTLVEQGDLTGYENFRREALARFTGSQQPFADRIVKISLLLPASQKIMKVLEPPTGVAVQFVDTNEDVSGDIFLAAWRSVSQALLEYRNGNFQKAADWSQQSLNYPEHIAPRTATARIILAMSDQKLGKTQEASSQLDAAREIIENKFRRQLDQGTPMQGFWFDWDFARILLNEATAMIQESLENTKK